MRRAAQLDVDGATVTHLTRLAAMRPEKACKSTASAAPRSRRTDPNLDLADERSAGIPEAAASTQSNATAHHTAHVERVETTRNGRHR